jgi:methyltransferase (TIGR00027 family)
MERGHRNMFLAFRQDPQAEEWSGVPTMLDAFTNVSTTALVTLFCRAEASRRPEPVLNDPVAESLADQLRPELAARADPLSKMLAENGLPRMLVSSMALRAHHFDAYARAFVARRPGAVVVNMGCGLDSRFQRIDDGQLRFYDVDLPPVMAVKAELLPPTDRYRQIASSVLDYDWLDRLPIDADGPFLFLAEGLFMYLPEADVRALILALQQASPGCELVCEVFNRRWLEGWRGRVMRRRLEERLHFGADAAFRSGLATSDEMETWGANIHCLGDWSYFDDDRMGALRILRHWPGIRKLQWTVHYRLDAAG